MTFRQIVPGIKFAPRGRVLGERSCFCKQFYMRAYARARYSCACIRSQLVSLAMCGVPLTRENKLSFPPPRVGEGRVGVEIFYGGKIMKRRFVSARKSNKIFKKKAQKSKALNDAVMRGGIRL